MRWRSTRSSADSWHCITRAINKEVWVLKVFVFIEEWFLSLIIIVLWISLYLLLWRFCPIGRSFFSPDIRTPQRLGDGLESWCGFYQSIRPTQMGLSLNIGIWIMIKFTKLLSSYLWLMFLIFCFYLYFTFYNRYGFSCIHWASPYNRVCCSASRQGCIVKTIVWCWSCEGTLFFLLLLQPGFILDIWFNHSFGIIDRLKRHWEVWK